MISTLSLLASLGSSPAQAASTDPEHFSLGVPLELAMVGLSGGVHPELLWRPFDAEGFFHLRAAAGVMVGPELSNIPLSVGIREVFFPTRKFRAALGYGLQLQTFLPYQHEAYPRVDQYFEFTLDAEIREGMRVNMQLSPEFGWYPGFGLGMAARAGVQLDFPLSAAAGD